VTELDLLALLKLWGPSSAIVAAMVYVIVAVCRRMEMQCRTCATSHNKVLAMLARAQGWDVPTDDDTGPGDGGRAHLPVPCGGHRPEDPSGPRALMD